MDAYIAPVSLKSWIRPPIYIYIYLLGYILVILQLRWQVGSVNGLWLIKYIINGKIRQL